MIYRLAQGYFHKTHQNILWKEIATRRGLGLIRWSHFMCIHFSALFIPDYFIIWFQSSSKKKIYLSKQENQKVQQGIYKQDPKCGQGQFHLIPPPHKQNTKKTKVLNPSEIYVGGLTKSMTYEDAENQVRELFPNAVEICIKTERWGGRRYGLASFMDEQKCQEALNNCEYIRPLFIRHARAKSKASATKQKSKKRRKRKCTKKTWKHTLFWRLHLIVQCKMKKPFWTWTYRYEKISRKLKVFFLGTELLKINRKYLPGTCRDLQRLNRNSLYSAQDWYTLKMYTMLERILTCISGSVKKELWGGSPH